MQAEPEREESASVRAAHDGPGDLLRCLRWDQEGDDALSRLDAEGWRALQHAVESGNGRVLLARRLERTQGTISPPPDIVAVLSRAQTRTAKRGFATARFIVDRYDHVRKPIMLLKGIDLAQRVYGSLGARSMSDVDLLVHADDALSYHQAFEAAGFVGDGSPTRERRAEALWSQTCYAAPNRRLYPIDLHWRLGKREALVEENIDTDGIWARAEVYGALGRDRIFVMAREDLLLYLCLHLRHHGFDSPLTQVWDIAEVLAWSKTGFDWDAFWTRAEEWRLTRTVRLAFRQARDTLGVCVPESFISGLPEDIAGLLPDVLPNLGRHGNHQRVSETYIADLFAPSIARGARLRRLWARVFPPRREIAARYGLADSAIQVAPAYLAYWWNQASHHGHFVVKWLSGDRDIRAQADRVKRLQEWLEADGDVV